jgi:hypothetical protein
MDMQIVSDTVSRTDLKTMAGGQFIDFVKAVVDIERKVMAIGGELHADEESLLLEQGSQQKDLWGINLYPDREGDEFVEFDSMINLRPSQGNRSRGVDDPDVRKRIASVVSRLVE